MSERKYVELLLLLLLPLPLLLLLLLSHYGNSNTITTTTTTTLILILLHHNHYYRLLYYYYNYYYHYCYYYYYHKYYYYHYHYHYLPAVPAVTDCTVSFSSAISCTSTENSWNGLHSKVTAMLATEFATKLYVRHPSWQSDSSPAKGHTCSAQIHTHS